MTTGFYMKCNTGLKWVNGTIASYFKCLEAAVHNVLQKDALLNSQENMWGVVSTSNLIIELQKNSDLNCVLCLHIQ